MKKEYIVALSKDGFNRVVLASRRFDRERMQLEDPSREEIIRYVNQGLVNPIFCKEVQRDLR